MSLETAALQDSPKLVGDLHTRPKPERRLCNQDTYAIEWIIPHSGGDRPAFEFILRDIRACLESELASANPGLDAFLADKMGDQFRSRPDFARGKVAVEQWVPSMDCWMTNGYFDSSLPWFAIVDTLRAGSPERKSAEDELADRREASAKVRAANDQAHTDRVLGTIDALTDRQVRQFVEVEQALQTGDRVTAMGDDGHKLDLLVSDTKRAAALGDAEAQRVLIQGQGDTPLCSLPSSNPFRHRHRSERQTTKEDH